VEEAAAEERVGQLLLVVGGDDDDRPLRRLHRLPRLVDVELHSIELLEEVVREFDVALSISSMRRTGKLGEVNASQSLPR
jgi:hypothetical protein